MEKIVKIEEYLFDNLSIEEQNFLKKSKEASKQSYAPYSEFHVGCSVLHQNGHIGLGSNQENASFPSGLCAERVALFESAKTLEENRVTEIAVYATSSKYKVPKMLVPCAACLQVISDIQNRQFHPIKIWMWDGKQEVYCADNVRQFLPFHFELEFDS